MKGNLALVLALALALAGTAGCGGGDPQADGGTDGDGDTDADGDGDGGGTEVPDETVILEVGEDGVERGTSVVDGRGVVYFYSESRQAFWEIAVVDVEGAATAPGSEVHLAVDPDGTGHYLVWDPSFEHMPMVFAAETPTEGTASSTVDAFDLFEGEEPFVEFVEEPPNPFAFTVLGITVSINIQTIVRSMAWGMALSVFKSLVTGTCNTVAPLYDDICSIVGEVVTVLSAFVRPGFQLSTGAIALRAAADQLAGSLIEYGADKLCGGVASMVLKALDENEDLTDLRRNYRAAVFELHYLLWQREVAPPTDPVDLADLDAVLRAVAQQLAEMGPHLRQGYVTILSPAAPAAVQGPIYSRVISQTKRVIVTMPHRVVWRDVFVEQTTQAMFGPLPEGGVVLVDVPTGFVRQSQETLERIDTKLARGLWSCTLSVWTELEVHWRDEAADQIERLSMPLLFERAVDASRAQMRALHRDIYGDDIPDPTCEFDEYEPNATWQAALASPTSFMLATEPVWLRDLTLCSVTGVPTDDDWYAFPMGAIEFDIQARVREPENPAYRYGQDQPVCLEMYYYGETNELAMVPPTAITVPTCGTAGSTFFDVGPVGVRRAMGESWSFILVHVYPGAGADASVGYDLGFTL